MLKTAEGICHAGIIQILETPEVVPEGRVLIVFLGNEKAKPALRQMQFGQFAGKSMSTEEDFKAAEWHGDKPGDLSDD